MYPPLGWPEKGKGESFPIKHPQRQGPRSLEEETEELVRLSGTRKRTRKKGWGPNTRVWDPVRGMDIPSFRRGSEKNSERADTSDNQRENQWRGRGGGNVLKYSTGQKHPLEKDSAIELGG